MIAEDRRGHVNDSIIIEIGKEGVVLVLEAVHVATRGKLSLWRAPKQDHLSGVRHDIREPVIVEICDRRGVEMPCPIDEGCRAETPRAIIPEEEERARARR